jgi:hypothetical protein
LGTRCSLSLPLPLSPSWALAPARALMAPPWHPHWWQQPPEWSELLQAPLWHLVPLLALVPPLPLLLPRWWHSLLPLWPLYPWSSGTLSEGMRCSGVPWGGRSLWTRLRGSRSPAGPQLYHILEEYGKVGSNRVLADRWFKRMFRYVEAYNGGKSQAQADVDMRAAKRLKCHARSVGPDAVDALVLDVDVGRAAQP